MPTVPTRVLPLLLPLVAACAAPRSEPLEAADVQRILDRQRDAWNAGDLRGFMHGYLESDDLTFVGSSGLTRGHAETLARYLASYPDEASRGTLSFELVEVRSLGADAALAIGRWHLQRDEPASGWFTLVLQRASEGWRIVHDHSS